MGVATFGMNGIECTGDILGRNNVVFTRRVGDCIPITIRSFEIVRVTAASVNDVTARAARELICAAWVGDLIAFLSAQQPIIAGFSEKLIGADAGGVGG